MRFDPFHCTVEPLTKLLPFTVRVKADPPAVADEGLIPVVAGTGLLIPDWVHPDQFVRSPTFAVL